MGQAGRRHMRGLCSADQSAERYCAFVDRLKAGPPSAGPHLVAA
jgi:hypothetical protein